MKYARVEGGEVVETRNNLPSNFKSVSGFANLSEDERKQHGWYDIVNLTVPFKDYYEKSGENCIYDSNSDTVTFETTYTNMLLASYKIKRINQLKQSTAEHVFNVIPSWQRENATVTIALNGVNSPYTLTKAVNILNFAKQHKEAVDIIEQQILDATTHEEVKALPIIVDDINFVEVE